MAVVESTRETSSFNGRETSSFNGEVTPIPGEWAELAVCKGRTHLFFPPKAERPQARARREARARTLCESCPVQVPCREFARRNHEYGYWGGESEEDRHLAGFTVAAPIGIRARLPRSA